MDITHFFLRLTFQNQLPTFLKQKISDLRILETEKKENRQERTYSSRRSLCVSCSNNEKTKKLVGMSFTKNRKTKQFHQLHEQFLKVSWYYVFRNEFLLKLLHKKNMLRVLRQDDEKFLGKEECNIQYASKQVIKCMKVRFKKILVIATMAT